MVKTNIRKSNKCSTKFNKCSTKSNKGKERKGKERKGKKRKGKERKEKKRKEKNIVDTNVSMLHATHPTLCECVLIKRCFVLFLISKEIIFNY